MTKLEILHLVAGTHNRLADVMVSGDNAIMMGESLKELRFLANELQKDIEAESAKEQQEEPEE